MTDAKNEQLEYVRRSLMDRNLTSVASSTGLNPHTLYRIMSGGVKPHQSTLNLILSYLHKVSAAPNISGLGL